MIDSFPDGLPLIAVLVWSANVVHWLRDPSRREGGEPDRQSRPFEADVDRPAGSSEACDAGPSCDGGPASGD